MTKTPKVTSSFPVPVDKEKKDADADASAGASGVNAIMTAWHLLLL